MAKKKNGTGNGKFHIVHKVSGKVVASGDNKPKLRKQKNEMKDGDQYIVSKFAGLRPVKEKPNKPVKEKKEKKAKKTKKVKKTKQEDGLTAEQKEARKARAKARRERKAKKD